MPVPTVRITSEGMNRDYGPVLPEQRAPARAGSQNAPPITLPLPTVLSGAIQGRRCPMVHSVSIDLSTARTNERDKRIVGNFFWVDDARFGTSQDTTAEMTVRLTYPDAGGINCRLGKMIAGVEFDGVYLTNSAQAGKTINILYATLAGSDVEAAQ
jgi:hypothetical protein